MKVAVIEDNADLRSELEFLLNHAGHTVVSFAAAAPFYRYMETSPALDMLVLDLGLPDEDGLSVAENLKGISGLGIVMLTARGTLSDRIQGFESGADVYLTKPVNVTELNAVMDSIGRRIAAERKNTVSWNNEDDVFLLAVSDRQLFVPNGTVVSLTAAEGTIMKVLARSGFHAVSRKVLSEALGQDYRSYDERRLEAIVSRLRKKLKESCTGTDCIKAARGIGYQLTVLVKPG